MQKNDTIEINMSDLKPFLMPLSVLLSSIVLSMGIFFGLGSLGNSLRGTVTNTGTGTTTGTTTGGTTGTTTTTGNTTAVTKDTLRGLFTNEALAFGDPNSNLLLVEVADPSCPYCHIAGGKNPELNKQAGTQFLMVADGGAYVAPVPEFKRLVDEGKAAFVYIYSNGHGNGRLAAQAQYCADEQGKFWEVHDLLMSNAGYSVINDQVKNDVSKASVMADFLAPAIDKGFMQSCLESNKYDAKLNSDETLAGSLGVNGTPGFFVNETNYPGAYSYKDMEATINANL